VWPSDILEGGEDDDTIYGGSGDDPLIDGGDDDDVLWGEQGQDTIYGADGDDEIHGGSGNDVLSGGVGQDTFWFDAPLPTWYGFSLNVDDIGDFSVADDTIVLDNDVFTALTNLGTLSASAFRIGSAAADASDRIIYNSSTGALLYDSDGTGSAGADLFATLSTGLALTSADFLVSA
jgi:Ca2+-binding RTX toxin-like protein